jgi:HlyD family secretion protein
MPNPKKRRKIIVFSVVGLALVGLAIFAFYRKREVVITVQTDKVTRRNLTEIVSYNGKIQPVLQVKISPEVSGEIIALPVKEGQCVTKGDLILKIKPDFYLAARNQSEAAYKSSLASKTTAEATLRKAEAEYRRNQDLFTNNLVSPSTFDEVRASYDIAKAQVTNSEHQVEMARASLASSEDALAKTTIFSPLTGTISKLNSEVGERVVGTATMAGTEVMTIADLNQMEARVDIGEMDVVLVKPGQHARLEVDAFKDLKFEGIVTEVANSAVGSGLASTAAASQDATKFEVRIRIKEKEAFRPGMSVTAEIETRARTNVLTVPIASVTTRAPKPKGTNNPTALAALDDPPAANSALSDTNASAARSTTSTNGGTGPALNEKKLREASKPIEVVFVLDGDHAKMAPVKLGILDDTYYEITDGLQENQEVISGGFRAIRDLEDGKRVRKGTIAEEKKQN